MCSWLWLWLSSKEEEHLRVGHYPGARELLHPWDPKGPLLKSQSLHLLGKAGLRRGSHGADLERLQGHSYCLG